MNNPVQVGFHRAVLSINGGDGFVGIDLFLQEPLAKSGISAYVILVFSHQTFAQNLH